MVSSTTVLSRTVALSLDKMDANFPTTSVSELGQLNTRGRQNSIVDIFREDANLANAQRQNC